MAHASAGQQEHSASDQQQELLPDDNSAANDSSSATSAYEPMQVTDEEILDWGSTLLADDAEPAAEHHKTDEQ